MYHTKLLNTKRIDGAVSPQIVFSLSALIEIILYRNSLRTATSEDKTLINQHSVFMFNNKPYLVVVFYRNTRGTEMKKAKKKEMPVRMSV
jgi:hypothetical protein